MGFIKKQKCHTKDISIPDFYNLYVEKAVKKQREHVSYKVFSNVMKDFNLILRDKIVYKSETAKLPYKLGELSIHKFETTYDIEKQGKWSIDFKATKEAGTIIYHGAPYGYRWKWNKRGIKLKGKRYYNFKPCRKSSRMIADAIKNKQVDYYN